MEGGMGEWGSSSFGQYFIYLVVDKGNNRIQLSNNKSTTLDKWHTT
jgi:hypothetical protein